MAENTDLRLLLVEDSADDELMILHALGEYGFTVEHRRVETEAELSAALAEGGWQAVISDHNLPGFDGLKALDMVRAWGPYMPFLFVSGTASDDVGVRAMASGANDYLLKGNLTRLGPALTRELKEAHAKRAGRITAVQYKNILDTASDAIITIDEDSRIVLFNRSAEAIFGWSAGETLGQPLDILIPERYIASHARHVSEFAARPDKDLTVRNGTSYFTARRKDGSEFPAEVNLSSTKVDGRTTFTAILRDITERHEAEQALRKSEMRFRLMTANIKDYSIIMLDSDGRVMSWNEGAQRIKGYTPDEILGKPMSSLYSEQDIASGRPARLLEAARNEGRVEDEGWQIRKDGSSFYANVVLTTMLDDAGALIGFAKITRDITERKALEDALKRQNEELEARVDERTAQLEQARREAERLTQAKSDFLSNMSHEIRTPMNAVLGLAYMLEQMKLPGEAAELAHKIHRSGQSLLGILNDILDFSKIEAGRLVIEDVPFYLGDVLDNLATIMATSASGKGLELSIAPPPFHACHLRGDALRIGQVLINLTSNAIKFTADGLVEVKIDLVGEHDNLVTLRFSVHDTGIGMDADTQSHLFAPFVQADASTTRRFGGTGLGLAISRRLVEMMGGKMCLQSEPGQGSTFSFTLDLPHQDTVHNDMQELLDLNVLVADDNVISLEGLGATVRSMGWTPELLDSGVPALRRILDEPRFQGPNTALLLDWRMPDMDGIDVAREICAKLPRDSRPIMLLVSAYSHDLLQSRLEAECVDAVLAKPLGPSMLYNAIMRARSTRLRTSSTNYSIDADNRRLVGLRILVVDDSEINREVAERIFSLEGAAISLVENGQQALDWLAVHPKGIDIILMDVHMPVMDGLEATRRIRQTPGLGTLPVVALTAGALQEQRDSALEAGMSGFIPKPFVVESAVNLILSLTRAAGAAPPADAPTAPETPSGQAILNIEYGLSLFKTPAALQRYLRLFARQYQTQLDVLAQDSPEGETLLALAHKLRGTAGNLGLERLSASAGTVETLLKRGQEAQNAIERLHDDLVQTLLAIAEYLPAEETADAPPPAAPDRELIAPLLTRALAGLATFNPDVVEPELEQLGRYLPARLLATAVDAVTRFSFDEAETALRKLASDLEIPLER